jgi:phosphate transport system permease protein
MRTNHRRAAADSAARSVLLLLTFVALIPLLLVLTFTVVNGVPTMLRPDFFLHVERPVGVPGAGVFHAIWGTLILVGLASLMAIPLGIIGGVHLAEYGQNRFGQMVRVTSDALVAAPSIVAGLFAYAVVVAPMHHFSAFSGSVALAILMIPVVLRTTDAAVALVPGTLREAGLALGLPRWRVSLQLVLRAAIPGVATGALLSIARAAGETAPLLFTSFGNTFFSLDPSGPMSALPLIVFHDALTPYPELQARAWGAALLLVLLVLFVNLLTRLFLRRQAAMVARL